MSLAMLHSLPNLWAMKADALSTFVEATGKASGGAGSANASFREEEPRFAFEVFDGIATIPVCGPLTKNGLCFCGVQFSAGMPDAWALLTGCVPKNLLSNTLRSNT